MNSVQSVKMKNRILTKTRFNINEIHLKIYVNFVQNVKIKNLFLGVQIIKAKVIRQETIKL